MDLLLTPTTELEAVNLMLSVIGESPVNSVDTSGLADANTAYNILNFCSREVQLAGWHWNTEPNFPLTPTPAGNLMLPANTLKVDTDGAYRDKDYIQRGTRLYDRFNHSYTFDHAVTVEIVLLLPFDEIPEAARSYITIRAARQFQERVVGSEVLSAFTQRDEFAAMAKLKDAEAETADFNILDNAEALNR